MSRLAGQCLCGAVRITAVPRAAESSACHCETCRRWSGAAVWGFVAAAEDVTVAGEVRSYPSSAFAERAFCPVCGTHLWIRDHDQDYDLLPGLFDGAAAFPLSHEVYSDRAFAAVCLAGAHPRLTRAEYQASHPFAEGDCA